MGGGGFGDGAASGGVRGFRSPFFFFVSERCRWGKSCKSYLM